jgi:hypothetical protein
MLTRSTGGKVWQPLNVTLRDAQTRINPGRLFTSAIIAAAGGAVVTARKVRDALAAKRDL